MPKALSGDLLLSMHFMNQGDAQWVSVEQMRGQVKEGGSYILDPCHSMLFVPQSYNRVIGQHFDSGFQWSQQALSPNISMKEEKWCCQAKGRGLLNVVALSSIIDEGAQCPPVCFQGVGMRFGLQ